MLYYLQENSRAENEKIRDAFPIGIKHKILGWPLYCGIAMNNAATPHQTIPMTRRPTYVQRHAKRLAQRHECFQLPQMRDASDSRQDHRDRSAQMLKVRPSLGGPDGKK